MTDGYALALVDANGEALAEAIRTFEDQGATAIAIPTDVREHEACTSAVGAAVARFGGIDVLVNAAGVYPRRPVLEISADDWQFVFQVNVLGTYFMMIEAITAMRAGAAVGS